ncbi:unnamed protein product [Acanthoscelides obtectus]|uniref:Uncharacterized protein n=1 Tax=Acanthoscelides obtectus TaxID=200917 RepID=A0A9P0KY34_ACAOB|nr:unnamed protein product [Acanthoscelides obtectus]CAK1655123.1 hypothetical protein AOBTE_LOCUS19038 [Acanthoscelides obtectus]
MKAPMYTPMFEADIGGGGTAGTAKLVDGFDDILVRFVTLWLYILDNPSLSRATNADLGLLGSEALFSLKTDASWYPELSLLFREWQIIKPEELMTKPLKQKNDPREAKTQKREGEDTIGVQTKKKKDINQKKLSRR